MKQLTDKDVFFADVPPQESQACVLYELARESKTLRMIFEQGFLREQNPDLLPREAPEFLRPMTKSEYDAVLRDQANPTDEVSRRGWSKLRWDVFVNDWGRLLDWNALDDEIESCEARAGLERAMKKSAAYEQLTAHERFTWDRLPPSPGLKLGTEPPKAPYFLTRPYLELDASARIRKLPTRLAAHFARLPLHGFLVPNPLVPNPLVPNPLVPNPSADAFYGTDEGEYVLVHIGWAGRRNEELAAAFPAWAAKNRPKKFPEPKNGPKVMGWKTPARQAALELRKLAACRLLAHYPDFKSLPPKYEAAWFKNRKLMRANAMSVGGIFRRYFPFLDPAEFPDSYLLCSDLGRFVARR